jgi:hypothetical protein
VNGFAALAVGGVEVTAADYARRPITLATTVDGVTLANTASIEWPYARTPWGTIDGILLWEIQTAGVQLALLPTAALTIRRYDIARIPAGGIAVTYGGAPRPYGVGRYGAGTYGLSQAFGAVSAVLERGFDDHHVCAPGTWARAA